MKYIKKFESFGEVSHISDLKKGDIITYQGSKCEVLSEDDFAITVKSLQTNNQFIINQGQLEENGVKIA